MNKHVKKIFALAMTVIMLCSALSIQSFAAFDFLKAPTITDVTLSENSFKSVSVKEMTAYYKEVDEAIEELEKQFGSIDELLGEGSYFNEYIESIYNFDLGYSNLDYEFVVTLSNGKTFTVSSDDMYSYDINSMYSFEIEAYVTKDEYLKAKNKGAKNVNVTVKGQIFSNILEDYTKDGDFTTDFKMKTVSSVVKSITPVSGVPSKLYEDADYVELSGAKFKISYADGTTKTAKVKQKNEIKGELGIAMTSYELDGNELLVWEYEDDNGKDILGFSYLDAEYTKKVSYTKSLFKSIKINKCDYDFEKGLSSITYTLTRTNGESKKYTKEFTDENAINFYRVIDFVDGYYITLSPYSADYEMSEEQELKVSIYVTAGEVSSEPVEYDIPYSDTVNAVLKFVQKIAEAIRIVTNFITALFASGSELA